MSLVFVLDTKRQPLDPVHPGKARLLLKRGQAAVFRRYPFTIMLKAARPAAHLEPLRLEIDPGSKTTGLALVNDARGAMVWAAELSHRGQVIKKRLDARRAVRRSRRQRKTRYRKARLPPPAQAARMASAVAREPPYQRPDLGGAIAAPLPH